MEEKDLKSLNIRTDLVTDIIPNINTTVNEETYEKNNIRVSNIFLDSKSSKLIGKKKGNYTTIFFEDITDKDNYNNVLNISNILNTICNATEERQKEAQNIAGEVDTMLVVGGRHSSNTQKLFEICKEECGNTYYIQTPVDLDSEMFHRSSCVGITAGASTPKKIIEEVQEHVRIKF
mgnify:CR=1 FL=1